MKSNIIKKVSTLIFLCFLIYNAYCSKNTNYKYPRTYSNKDILKDNKTLDDFINKIIVTESFFNQPDIGYSKETGFTYDGYCINSETGELIGVPRNWSAPSKESLHVILLSMAVYGSKKAKLFVDPKDISKAKKKAIDILSLKIKTYENFNKKYPGYGGFIPWVVIKYDRMDPTSYAENPNWDWQNRVPGLDNGEWVWSLFLCSFVLEKEGFTKLAKRYKDYWVMLAKNSVPIFYDKKQGKIRAEVNIKNTSKKNITKNNYSNRVLNYFLDDPYEGELLTLFMTLFGNWKSKDIEKIWMDKYINKTTYITKNNKKISVRLGHWYSAHEVWNFLILPYRDDDLIKEIFRLGEVARTYNSVENNIPGLFASVNPPPQFVQKYSEYLSGAGIQSIATNRINNTDIVTPYAAFPVIIADKKKGILWYKEMISGPKMIGPYGASEAITTNGRNISPYLTWDAKITTILAIINEEIMEVMRTALKEFNKYDDFLFYIKREYSDAFGSVDDLEGKDLTILPPSSSIPLSASDFSNQKIDKVNIMNTIRFFGGGALYKEHKYKPGGNLEILNRLGYIWTKTDHIDIKEYRYLNFSVNTSGEKFKGVFIELKNTKDLLITDGRIRVEFPDTKNKFKLYSIDVKDRILNKNSIGAIFGMADSNSEIIFKEIYLTNKIDNKSKFLYYNGRSFSNESIDNNNIYNDNIIKRVFFVHGGNIQCAQKKNLYLKFSEGFLWGYLPNDISSKDLNIYNTISITARTEEFSTFNIELKHMDIYDQEMDILNVADSNKIKISFPNTNGDFKTYKFDIKINKKSKMPHFANIVAISDPVGNIEISEMKLTKSSSYKKYIKK